MWICSKLGFFSVVRKGRQATGAPLWHVRARCKNDLADLLATAGLDAPIERWPEADYRWRARIGQADLDRVFQALEASVDYPNFKSQIAATPSQRAKLDAYAELWARLLAIQED